MCKTSFGKPPERKRRSNASPLPLVALMATFVLGCGLSDFEKAQQADSVESYETYLEKRPNDVYASAAAGRLDELRFERASESSTVEDWQAYVDNHHNSKLIAEARRKLKQAKWAVVTTDESIEKYEAYLTDKPEGSYRKQAEERIRILQYLQHVALTPLVVEQPFPQEDGTTPNEVWAFRGSLQNRGEVAIVFARLTFDLLASSSEKVLDRRTLDLVVEPGTEGYSGPPENVSPLMPGSQRAFAYLTSDLPEGWSGRAKVRLTDFQLR